MSPVIRAFIAIPLENEITNAISSFITKFGLTQIPGLRLVKPGNIHITLKFLGESQQEVLNKLNTNLERIASENRPFHIQIKDIGAFPGWKAPRIIWIGVKAPDVLQTLYSKIEIVSTSFGFPTEGRRFNPHLTLARINNHDDDGTLQGRLEDFRKHLDHSFGEMSVASFTLFRSELKPGGSVYKPIRVYKLNTPRVV